MTILSGMSKREVRKWGEMHGERALDTELVVGIEEMEPGHWVAWILAVPGCYARGTSEAEALLGVPEAWLAETDCEAPDPVQVVERWRGVPSATDPDFIINATFADDRRPLRRAATAEEIAAGIERLGESHRLFLELVAGRDLSEEVGRLIRHIATAEQWYLRNIGLVVESEPPEDPMERFAWTRAFSLRVLPSLAGREIVTDCGGEGWTPRKVLRRMIWHERDHTGQIAATLADSS